MSLLLPIVLTMLALAQDAPDTEATETPAATEASEASEASEATRATAEVRDPGPLLVEIEVTEFTSTPLRVTVPQGRKVRIAVKNTGTVTHSLRIAELHVGTDALQPGETQIIEFVPRRAGTFLFECGITGHREVGVPGRFVVEEATAQNVLRRSM